MCWLIPALSGVIVDPYESQNAYHLPGCLPTKQDINLLDEKLDSNGSVDVTVKLLPVLRAVRNEPLRVITLNEEAKLVLIGLYGFQLFSFRL